MLEAEKRFKILLNTGFSIEPELLVNDYYSICNDYELFWYDDNKPKNLFVSKHKNVGNGLKRCSKRVQGKRDQGTLDVVIVLVSV